jgi:hypothetical protein
MAMARLGNFVFRVNDDERHLITVLAQRLRRTESDAMRFLIRQAVQSLESEGTPRNAEVAKRSEVNDAGHFPDHIAPV